MADWGIAICVEIDATSFRVGTFLVGGASLEILLPSLVITIAYYALGTDAIVQ